MLTSTYTNAEATTNGTANYGTNDNAENDECEVLERILKLMRTLHALSAPLLNIYTHTQVSALTLRLTRISNTSANRIAAGPNKRQKATTHRTTR